MFFFYVNFTIYWKLSIILKQRRMIGQKTIVFTVNSYKIMISLGAEMKFQRRKFLRKKSILLFKLHFLHISTSTKSK